MIVGQTQLTKLMLDSNLGSFPHSLLLVGEKGCGKHLFANAFASHFGYELIDITELLTNDLLVELSLKPTITFCLVDLTQLTEKEQNILLKSLEDAPEHLYFILLAETLSYVLDTVVNRCYTAEFAPYSVEELKQFLPAGQSEELLQYFRTPGKLLSAQKTNLEEMLKICNILLDKLETVNYANLLVVASKINYKDEYDKYDLDLFMGVLIHLARSKYVETKKDLYRKCYNICQTENKKLEDKRLNKQYFVYNLLTNLWEAARC